MEQSPHGDMRDETKSVGQEVRVEEAGPGAGDNSA